jgi:hypothetical protein
MKKHTAKKVREVHKIRKSKKNGRYLEFFGVGIGMFVGVLAIAGYTSADKPYVLGTSVFLAHDGVSGDGDNSQSGPSVNEHEDRQGPPSTQPNNSGPGKMTVSSDSLVDCVSPEGKHIRETFQACSALNKASNQSNFSFTVLKQGKNQKMPPPANVAPSGAMMPDHENEGEMGSGSGKEIGDHHFYVKKGNNNNIVLRHNNTETKTTFPLSIDPTTNKLTITTPSGKKEVSVLPDEAVERVLQTKTLSNVENQASSGVEDGGDVTSHTTLTELNNKPVFQVKGFSNKKVFGLIPASFAKTVYVSAEDGSVVKTDETFVSKALEILSF